MAADVTQTTQTYLSTLSEPGLGVTTDDWKIEEITDAVEKACLCIFFLIFPNPQLIKNKDDYSLFS